MKNKTYKFADIVADVSYETDYVLEQCKDYISGESAELNISVAAEDVEIEKKRSDGEEYPYGYLESLALFVLNHHKQHRDCSTQCDHSALVR